MKSIWNGNLAFGLVSIKIELFSAVQEHYIGFNLLHAKCHTPIQNKRICPRCNKTLIASEIVKGLKLPDGSFMIIKKEDLDKLKPPRSDNIEIIEFVDTIKINPIYYHHHYFVLPAKSTDKAFFLFLQALNSLNKSAIGRIIFKDKEYLCSIQPY
jgi:DNA end-binding protein Ku